jgi:hypothetical protein
MTIVQPTFKRIALIWLSISLRALLLGIVAAIAASVVIGVAVASSGGGEDQVQALAKAVGPVIGLMVSLYAGLAQFGRKCGDVRLVLVSAE